ncbi:MAG: COG3014 family protein [Marinobacter sp.]|uniref:COG3014 family protein n=2 Tax=Marinobacter sp. TaxID=50741 RepID=UPI003F9B6321
MTALKRLMLAFAVVAFASGCSSVQHRNQLASFNAAYAAGDYDSALQTVSFDVDEGKSVDSEAHLLELLHQGEMYRLTGRYDESTKAYDLAEEGMKYLDTEGFLKKASEGFMSVMVNDSQRDYEALMSEAVLVNTYKGLAFLAAGNSDYARIEFNRANERTRRAVDYFQKEISEQQAALKKEAQTKGGNASIVRNSLRNEDFQTAVSNHYGEASNWSVYPDFIVPSSTYLHGLYFLANATGGSDYERAATSLKRVAQMKPESTVLKADADLATSLASGKQSLATLPPQVWVVYENGLGPALQESRFEVPLLLARQGRPSFVYFGIALPKYTERAAVPGDIGMVNDVGEVIHTEKISDMGTVIRTEMKERFAGVLTRAVSSAVIKAVLQREVAEQFGAIGQLGALVFTAATTHADLRGWQAMPNHWQAARMDRPENGIVTLLDNRGEILGDVDIPQQPFTLVYVKRPTRLAPVTVITMDLQGASTATFARLPERSDAPAQVSSSR